MLTKPGGLQRERAPPSLHDALSRLKWGKKCRDVTHRSSSDYGLSSFTVLIAFQFLNVPCFLQYAYSLSFPSSSGRLNEKAFFPVHWGDHGSGC